MPEDTDRLIRRELRRVAELEPNSGRSAVAKTTALRALLRLNGGGGRGLTEAEERLWDPERDPNERVDRRDWHASGDPAWVELDLCKTVATRRRSWMHVHARRGR